MIKNSSINIPWNNRENRLLDGAGLLGHVIVLFGILCESWFGFLCFVYYLWYAIIAKACGKIRRPNLGNAP